MAKILGEFKFSALKYGEEAILDLPVYSLAGGGRSTALRRNVSNVEKSGVTVREYRPQNERDYVLEKKLPVCPQNGMPAKNTK
jgi:lysylphosphatidylglycerol synthetase-like protein (DUF2156 family)